MKNSERKKTEGGFIALTSVLIIGAVVLVLGVSLFHSGLTSYSISSAYESGQEAAFLADFCVKEGVLKLKEDINYSGAEDIEVNGMVCYISPVKDVNGNTKKVSSLGKAGDQPHFSRSSQLIRYVIESKESDWKKGDLENLEIVEDSLKLKRPEEIVILNSASGESCDTRCPEETGYPCKSVGTDPLVASGGSMWTAQENEEYSCRKEGADCGTIMLNYSQELADCYGNPPVWTYCKCQQEIVAGHRISPEFNISGLDTVNPDIVKDSQIFWQADERFNGTISVKIRVSYDNGDSWEDWETIEPVVNGASIPGLEPGTSLSGVKIQTKTSFVGGPDFYPSLENIKIFLEIE